MYLAATGRPEVPPAPSGVRRRVSGTVLALGAVSLVTDISSEMVTAVLPLYFVVGLGLSPLQFGFLDGLFNGATAVVRLLGGHLADRGGRHRTVAGLGYLLSACSRLGLLAAGGAPAGIATALAADRVGKGIRTAPRDALITLNSPPDGLGRAFGVHRAMDTTGALLGPLAAFALLWATADAYDAVFVVSFCTGLMGVLLLFVLVPGRSGVRAPRPADGLSDGRAGASAADVFNSGRAGAPVVPGAPGSAGAPSGARPGAARAPRRLLAPLRSRAFRRVLFATALLGAATVSDAFVYLLLQRELDLDAAWFPLLPLGAAAGYLVLAVPAGRLADRVGRRLPFLYGHGALIAAYALLLAPVGADALLVPVLGLLGVFYAATDGVLMALAAPLLPKDRRASGLALLQTAQAVSRLVAATAFGAAWTAWGPGQALTCALAALTVGLAGAWRLLPDTAPEPETAPAPDDPAHTSPERPSA